jgi:hypothetical protein
MNTYTVTVPGSEPGTIEAHDWVHNGGLVIFQDDIGRCLVAIAVEDGLRIDCAYGNDELFPKLADFKPPSTKDNAMSWTRNTGTVTKADAAKALLALAPAKTDEPGADAEVQAQLQSVADVLPALLATVGRADDQVQVEVAGHANPEREPVDDVSDEVLYVTVRCIPAKPAEVPTPE